MVHKRKMNNKGFSLVEVIISIAILAIISIPLLNYFTDSMKHNALARTRQQATIEAQNIMEQLKAEDKLLKPDTLTGKYVSPYFSVKGISYSAGNYHMDAAGIGYVTYQCAAGSLSSQYDVEVTMESSADYNADPLPVIYGIDETKDVLAIEKDQYTEARDYFYAMSVSAGRSVDIDANTTRTIHMDLKMDGSYYNVKIYYVYTCRNVMADGSDATYSSATLADVNLTSLDNLYLLFNRKQDNEQIIITNPDSISLPDMYLIWQSETADLGYRITITGLSGSEKAAGIIHTNVKNVYDELGVAVTKTQLNTTETPIRLVNIKVAVYPKDTLGSGSADAYVEIKSTKGE